jgi:hypothetical protein
MLMQQHHLLDLSLCGTSCAWALDFGTATAKVIYQVRALAEFNGLAAIHNTQHVEVAYS